MIRRLILLIILISSVSYAADRAIKPVREGNVYSVSAALLIGESDYTGGWPKLPGVKQDINAVESALIEHGFTVTKSMNPDKNGLKNAVESFLKRYGNDSKARLLIYFAGHGHTQGGKGYIVLRDAADPKNGMAGFNKGALEIDYFASKAASVNAKHTLFVFDSCFSGSIFSAMRSIPQFVMEMLKKPAKFFIASGTENQQVPDDSVFRRRFTDGIAGTADSNADGIITGSELGMYLQTQVSDYTKGSQTPVFGKMKNMDGEFVFFKKGTVTTEKNEEELSGEKEKLIAIMKKAPGSPEANNALKRLREIDDSLKNMPPVEAKERKDIVIKATSKAIIRYNDSEYPYVLIAPVTGTISGKNVTAAFRLTAKDRNTFNSLSQRKSMLASVMGKKISELTADGDDTMSEMRENIKSAAKEATDFACPACISEPPVLTGLKVY